MIVQAEPVPAPVPTGLDRLESRTWAGGPVPDVAVVVSTYDRVAYLAELVAALEAQSLPLDAFEVVVVDNGSGDGTWAALDRLVAGTRLRMVACRLPANRGPAGGRNAAARLVRAGYLAFTDDDCLPAAGWLEAVLGTFAPGVDLVQGRVEPQPQSLPRLGIWGHTIWVTGATPFYETCNVAYRRSAFEAVGGFDEDDPLTARAHGRAFGEDACLAWQVQEGGGKAAFAGHAVVEHRCTPGGFWDRLAEHRHLSGFPGLARRSPLVARSCWHRVFLTRRSAAFDLAVGAGVAGLVTRRPVLALGALPWLWLRWPEARAKGAGRRTTAGWRLLQLAALDLTTLVSLVEGSVRHRRLML